MAVVLGSVLTVIIANRSFAAESPIRPTVVSIVTTNWSPRYLTNIIQVSIPTNSFRDEFYTNWVEHRVTNTIDIFKTNVVSVDAFHTNIVVAYQTNLRTFTLTNWESVLVMKTNWVTRPVTNVVEIDLTAPAPAVVATPTPADAKPGPPARAGMTPGAASVDMTQSLEFELTHTAQTSKPDQYPIRLILKSTGEASAILPVQEWRVEKVGGGAFMVGSRAEFTGVLPPGEYKITARVRAADGTAKNIRGNTEVKADASPVRSPASVAATR